MGNIQPKLSFYVFLVSGIGIILAPHFFDRFGEGPWIAARVFFLFGVVLYLLKK